MVPETVLITLEDVSVSYRLQQGLFKRTFIPALRHVDMEVRKGESLGIVGRNGCGKSTLLRLLARIIEPDAGRMTGPTLRASLLSLGIGFADHLSGTENAVLSGMFLGMSKREITGKLENIAAFSELGDALQQPVSTYSSGMRARLGFAVAFQSEPDVLLVDEVLGVGDESFRVKSMAMMKERVQSRESTVVFVSHNAFHVRQLCDRAIWLEKGEVHASGETAIVMEKYKAFLTTLRNNHAQVAEQILA